MTEKDLLLVAGEASGDLHGSRLLSEMRAMVPDLRPFGLGSDQLRAAGLDLVASYSEISVVGIIEALRILPKARRIFRSLLDEVDRRGARTAVLIDFPDFNLRLAKALRKRGVRVAYYISPQAWAWREGRVRTVAKTVDRMLVVFPFEVDFYARHGVEATHVGHPLVDEVPELPHIWDRTGEAIDRYRISLLPGSRRSEIRVLLPILLGAADRLRRRLPVDFSLIRAPTIAPEEIEDIVAQVGTDVEIVSRRRFERVADSHLALCAAGTATLEVGLLGTPMIVTHRVARWSYVLARPLIDLDHASLVNLLLDGHPVTELLQDDARPESLAEAAESLLADRPAIDRLRRRLGELRPGLGPTGASRYAAGQIVPLLERSL